MKKSTPAANPEAYVRSLTGWRKVCVEGLRTAAIGAARTEEVIKCGNLVFLSLGHPAVVTVAAVLVVSRGLLNAGVVGTLARHLTRVGDQPWIQGTALTGIVALSSEGLSVPGG